MLKTLLLASSFMIAVPAFAQDAPGGGIKQQMPAPPTDQTSPSTSDDAAPGTQGAGTAEEADAAPTTSPAPAAEAAQPTPDGSAPASATSPAQPTTTPENPTAATTTTPKTAAAVASTQGQVAQAIGREFAAYDKDANGALNKTEFNSWMVALRRASEPGFQSGSSEANTWLTNAFATSDTDKSGAVSTAELTSFLTPKAS